MSMPHDTANPSAGALTYLDNRERRAAALLCCLALAAAATAMIGVGLLFQRLFGDASPADQTMRQAGTVLETVGLLAVGVFLALAVLTVLLSSLDRAAESST